MDRSTSTSSNSIELASEPRFQLGRLLLDPPTHEVRFNGSVERLQPQVLKVLVALARRKGQVVSRDELADRCWEGRIVSDDVINRSILLLRGLGERSGSFSIQTVPKAGYRLIDVSPDARSRGLLPVIGLAGLAIIAAMVGSAWLPRKSADQSHPQLAAIQLLPFTGADDPVSRETARATDVVVADMLTNSGLPVLNSARVGSDSRFADFRLSGTVRSVGNEVEATLQLDDLKHGTLLLSRRFRAANRSASALPEQIGAFAATSLTNAGAMMALDREHPGDPRLTGEVLRQWTMMVTMEEPMPTYQSVDRLAERMPESAIAQLALALVTIHVLPLLPQDQRPAALIKARFAASRARQLAPEDGDLAGTDCGLHSQARLIDCERSLRKSFKDDPDSLFAASGLRNQLVNVGRFREALDYDRLAVGVMPYMAGRLSASTMLLEGLGDRARAQEQYNRIRRWWPGFGQIFANRVEGILDRGNVDDAAAFIATIPTETDVIDKRNFMAIATDIKADRPPAVRERCSSSAQSSELDYLCLVGLTKLGDIDGAMIIADRLYPVLLGNDSAEEDKLFLARPQRLGTGVLSSPALAPLRQDSRFVSVAERVGLLQYWRQVHLPDFCTLRREPVCRLLTR